jgi:TetR/AcrR family transcriptional regulator
MINRVVKVVVTSRDRLLAAAAKEFAARGYDGTSVDRIARAARLNKAMIYYHFKSKAGLYRSLVRRTFEAVLQSATEVAEADATPAEKLRRFVRSVADHASHHPHFPSIWLREFSGGAAHVDLETLRVAGRVVMTLGRILEDGRERGVFRPASPFLVHVGIVAPILLFLVSEAALERLGRADAPGVRDLTLEQAIQHVTESTLRRVCIHAEDIHA